MSLTVLVPTGNAADVIEDCLRSVTFADELLVVDSFSSDGTMEIARRYATRVIQREYGYSASQKNWAIPQAAGDWVLIVDTDERVTPELQSEVLQAIQSSEHDGYLIPRLNHCFGRPMRHGGNWPDHQLRLFRRDLGRYEDVMVHAPFQLDGRKGVLRNHLLHFGQRSVSQITRVLLQRYTTWEAIRKHKAGVRFSMLKLITRPPLAFGYRYFYKKGFLDGPEGLFMALVWSAYVFITFCKLWRLQSGASDPAAAPDAIAGERP